MRHVMGTIRHNKDGSIRDKSHVEERDIQLFGGVCKLVHFLCDEHAGEDGDVNRKEVVERCKSWGICEGTANTQISKWRRDGGLS